MYLDGQRGDSAWKEESGKADAEVFDRASRQITRLLTDIDEACRSHGQQLRMKNAPNFMLAKAPLTPFLLRMFWNDGRELRYMWEQLESEDKYQTLDPELRRSLTVKKPSNGPWTITVDSTRATDVESICWMEFDAIVDWIKGDFQYRSERVEMVPWDVSPTKAWVKEARGALKEWFNVLFSSGAEDWYDAESFQNGECMTNKCQHDSTERGLRGSLLSGSHQRPSMEVTGGPTGELPAPDDLEGWEFV